MRKWLPIALVACVMSHAPSRAAVNHTAKIPTDIVIEASRPCAFFLLTGVTVADPNVASIAASWFAIPVTHPAFSQVIAILMTARVSNLPVSVKTTGGLACGFAGVDQVVLL